MYPQVDLKLSKQLRMTLKLPHHLLLFLGAGIIAMYHQTWLMRRGERGMEARTFFMLGRNSSK